jgi:hypothetical protein
LTVTGVALGVISVPDELAPHALGRYLHEVSRQVVVQERVERRFPKSHVDQGHGAVVTGHDEDEVGRNVKVGPAVQLGRDQDHAVPELDEEGAEQSVHLEAEAASTAVEDLVRRPVHIQGSWQVEAGMVAKWRSCRTLSLWKVGLASRLVGSAMPSRRKYRDDKEESTAT